MSRVKFDYIVSFSSEDPEHKADNLLNWEVSKKRWLCAMWEPSCSVVIQLKRMVQISAVQIGAYHSALVEVLVGRSEKPNEQFQVLVPRSVFVSPRESRGEGVERVRSFPRAALCDVTRDLRWDRLRIVCSQPYNKQCQYGLYFVHVDSLVEAASGASESVVPARLQLLARDSDDDEFTPGDLFREHWNTSHHRPIGTSPDVQSRQTFTQAAEYITDTSGKLVKTSICKNINKTQIPTDLDPKKNRQSDNLLYNEDDDRPHDKIDRVMKRHIDDKTKEDENKTKQHQNKIIPIMKNDKKHADKLNSSRSKFEEFIDDTKKKDDTKKIDEYNKRRSNHNTRSENDIPSGSSKDTSTTRTKTDAHTKVPGAGVLRGVVFALSGYENPRRAQLRDLALRLGARYDPHAAAATHLICAFPNTPKLRSVRAGGGACAAVTGEWLEACGRAAARLPEDEFAVERRPRPRARPRAPPPHDPPPHDPPPHDPPPPPSTRDDECDTDDEIEKVLRKEKKRKLENERVISPRKTTCDVIKDTGDLNRHDASSDSDVAFLTDERIQGNVTVESDSEATDTEGGGAGRHVVHAPLPDLFAGARFLLQLPDAAHAQLVQRYLTAYGGCVLHADQLLGAEPAVEYILCEAAGSVCGVRGVRGVRVHTAWLWSCHARGVLCDPTPYLVR